MAYHSNGGYSGDERESRSGDDRPDSDLGDKPIYLLEHLATFTVNKETGIVFPADGMRRLLQLEKTTGIWSQKMQLCLDRQWVLIMDYETGNIIERFPASLIQTPTAFTSNDPMEMYNNILVFIVGGGSGIRSEMHIFQCQSISAVHLVEDLKQLRNGKPALQHRETIPQQQQAPPPPPPIKSQKMVRESFNYSHETDSEIGNLNDETSSTSSEKYERDVTVLNHCFDDIEKFIARLQHAAAASRELERRLRNRKSKKKDPGEGLLTLRTRPPHEKEFIDIFAKFKLSFNLLAKLKAHIHDPNAPELVHFLFTPLALIVDASHDTYYDPNLPSRVINPLLTREAINLLINCVTSKETELWRSLGEAWTVPKDQWKGHTASYHPVFFDGWSPDYPVVDELDQAPSTPTNIKKRIELQQHYSGDYDYETSQQSQHQQSPGSPGLRDFSARSDISIDSIERNGGIPPHNGVAQKSMAPLAAVAASNAAASSGGMMHEQRASVAGVGGVSGGSGGGAGAGGAAGWIEEMQARGAKIVQVTYPRTANNDKELTVVRGEYLEIIDDSRKWWKAKNSRGQVAHVPHTIVTMVNYNDSLNSPAYTQNNYGKQLNRQDSVSERYTQSGDSNPGNGPVPLQPASADWVRNKHIVSGSITGSMSSEDDMVELRSDRAMIGNGMNVPPPPPPPPPTAAPPPPRTLSRPNSMSRQSIISNTSAANAPQDVMQEELKQVLTLFREKRRTIEIMRTPEIFIQQSSSSSDVEKWLVAKGFSDKVVKKMHGLNGNELFALKRDTLEDYCGHDEGKRLASQITVQRNISGYKTARSTELQAILAKARKKTEE